MKKTSLYGAMVFLLCGFAAAQEYTVLHSFTNGADGREPYGTLAMDKAGNLYGVTAFGGSYQYCQGGCGTVYELSPNADGTWTKTVLHNFCSGGDNLCINGSFPEFGLTIDASGNLFGVTQFNASCSNSIGKDCGLIYELSPPIKQGGKWAYSVVYAFCQNTNVTCPDGVYPNGPMAVDAAGNLYGTTVGGGTIVGTQDGIAYELSHGANGWTETILYNFCSNQQNFVCLDGAVPNAGLSFDKSGNLYGTTGTGGSSKNNEGGTIFELSPSANGWTERVLTSFQSNSFSAPSVGLGAITIDPAGNLYTTYQQEQSNDLGGINELSMTGQMKTFSFEEPQDGFQPNSGLLLDLKHKVLYGTTQMGGSTDYGVIYQVNALGIESVLYNFCTQNGCTDGWFPNGGLIADNSGNLYGVTRSGGSQNEGTVFKFKP